VRAPGATRGARVTVRHTMGARTKSLNHLAGADGGAAGADADASPVPTPKPRHRSLRSLRLCFGRVGSRGRLDHDDDSLPASPQTDGVPTSTPTRVAGSADGHCDDWISDEAGRPQRPAEELDPKAAELYEILGVPPAAATPTQLNGAYDARARDVHPDLYHDQPDATANFQRLSAAYYMLLAVHTGEGGVSLRSSVSSTGDSGGGELRRNAGGRALAVGAVRDEVKAGALAVGAVRGMGKGRVGEALRYADGCRAAAGGGSKAQLRRAVTVRPVYGKAGGTCAAPGGSFQATGSGAGAIRGGLGRVDRCRTSAHAVTKPGPSVMWPCLGMDAKRWSMASTRWHRCLP